MSAVHAAAPGYDEARDPCGRMQPVPQTDDLVMMQGGGGQS